MEKSLFTLSFGFALLILATQHSFAQPAGRAQNAASQCAPRAAVLAALAQQFSEARRAIGIAGNGLVMEMFVNEGARTWTMTATRPDGITCLIASGSSYEAVLDPAPARGDPA